MGIEEWAFGQLYSWEACLEEVVRQGDHGQILTVAEAHLAEAEVLEALEAEVLAVVAPQEAGNF